jgi:hypothetical protein
MITLRRIQGQRLWEREVGGTEPEPYTMSGLVIMDAEFPDYKTTDLVS